jgi:hypothetical protein
MSMFSKFCSLVMVAGLGVAMVSATALAEPPKAPAEKKPAEKAAKDDKAAPAKDDKAAKKEMVSDEMAQRFLAFFEKLVGIVVANKEDCTKMATEVNAHVDASQGVIKDATDARLQGKDLPQPVRDKIAKRTADELGPAMMAKCSNDRGVMTAFARIKPQPKK